MGSLQLTHPILRSAAEFPSTGVLAIFLGRKAVSVALATAKRHGNADSILVGVIHRGIRHRVVKMRISRNDGKVIVKAVALSVDPTKGAASLVEGPLILRHGHEIEERFGFLRIAGEVSESPGV